MFRKIVKMNLSSGRASKKHVGAVSTDMANPLLRAPVSLSKLMSKGENRLRRTTISKNVTMPMHQSYGQRRHSFFSTTNSISSSNHNSVKS